MIIVTLPVRFRGRALVVRDPDGRGENYFCRGGKKRLRDRHRTERLSDTYLFHMAFLD
jgi:hypothetical protein